MRIQRVGLRAVSTVTIVGTALAAALLSAPAQASGPAAKAGPPAHTHLSLAAAAALSHSAGVISGVVDGAGARPLTGVCVVATGPGGSVFAMTQSDGRYLLGGLRPGGYTLHYSACAAGGHYVDQYSGGSSWPGGATSVTIAQGQARQLAPVTLSTTPSAAPAGTSRAISRLTPGVAALGSAALAAKASGSASNASHGAITGKVTGGGKALDHICVIAYGPGFNETRTSKTGRYRLGRLAPGRYTVLFSFQYCGRGEDNSNWLPQVYKNVNGPDFRHITQVRVRAGQTRTGIDAALQLGGQISGTVRSEHGKTLSRVCVFAIGKHGRFFVENNSESGKKGNYVVHKLFPGKYQVAFVPAFCGNTGNYIPQWWPNSATQKHAKTIVIRHGTSVANVDSALHPGAILSGVVRAGGPHGALLSGICVNVQPFRFRGDFPSFAFTTTDKTGFYRVVGLTTGRYRVFFSRDCGNNGNVLPVQRTVSLVAPRTTSRFDAFLPPGAIITGTVTNTHGAPIRGICVQASSNNSFGSATTRANGRYRIIALATARYTLEYFGNCGNPGSYAPQFYRGQVNFGSANLVSATAGRTTPGINVTMQPGGTISGVVTDARGQRLSRICVIVDDPSVERFGFPFDFSQTGKNGTYSVRNLVPGPYAVNFNCIFGRNNPFAGQWFMGQADQGTAAFVSAPAGVTASGINAVLRRGGFITGRVTSGGKPVSGVCVEVTQHGGPAGVLDYFNERSLGFTNSHGVYRVGPVDAAKYDVQFTCTGRLGNQWFQNTPSRALETPVAVTNGATTDGINANLTAGGSISGQVTAGANHPQPNVCVQLSDAADNSNAFTFTNRQGRYTARGLSSGTYQVFFSDCGFGRNHVELGTASKTVVVTAPGQTGVNENLVTGGEISGFVRGGPGTTPQAGACLAAVPVSPNSSLNVAVTGPNGGYQLTGMAPGKYDVFFGDAFCTFAGTGYAPQWYKDQASQATATAVTVTSGKDTKAISATLGADGTIAGTVTNQHGAAVAGECVTATPVNPVPDPLFGSVLGPIIGVSAANGKYSLVGAQPGKYTVEFSAACGATGFVTQWWRHSDSAAGATVVTVSANGTTGGIDASLHKRA